jgi:hypothetical protein
MALLLSMLYLVGCAAGSESSLPPPRDAAPRDLIAEGRAPDLGPPGDLFPLDSVIPPAADLGPDGPSCQIGTPDNCKSCGDSCPGSDSTTTARICRAGGQCDIECKGEHYDVNGDVLDGCENEDDLPIHDVESAAKSLGKVDDCDNTKTTTARMPSDDRKHQKAPTERSNGRVDWFEMYIDDDWCILDAKATVNLKNLPATSSYRLTANYKCDNGTSITPVVKTAKGGSSTTLAPSTGCTTVGDDSGTIQIIVEKLSGPHSTGSYTIAIEP